LSLDAYYTDASPFAFIHYSLPHHHINYRCRMSDEEPATERPCRRSDAVSNVDVDRIDRINALPDAILFQCFLFVGPGHFRFVAATCHHFCHVYTGSSINDEEEDEETVAAAAAAAVVGDDSGGDDDDDDNSGDNDGGSATSFKAAASSLSCARLYLEDRKILREQLSLRDILRPLVPEAMKTGNVSVLEWIRDNDYRFSGCDFSDAGFHGHVHVLQWAHRHYLHWYSKETLFATAKGGHISVFEWVLDHVIGLPIYCLLAPPKDLAPLHLTESERAELSASLKLDQSDMDCNIYNVTIDAAARGDLAILRFFKERDMICDTYFHSTTDTLRVIRTRFDAIWHGAVSTANMASLNWLLENGYSPPSSVMNCAIHFDQQSMVLWAHEQGFEWDERHCWTAALYGNLEMLQFLREQGCPWDYSVILLAHLSGNDHVVEWARANGCPERG
jgi:hypothetical protein